MVLLRFRMEGSIVTRKFTVFLVCCFVVWGCLLKEMALSANFNVNSAFDVNDLTPGNGLCVAYLIFSPPFFVLPFCTLRGAIEETNDLPGHDTVNLPSGKFDLTLTGGEENSGATGDLDIRDSLTIVGAGPEVTFIDGKSIDRIFDVVGTNTKVTIKNLTLLNGFVAGGAIDGHRGGGAVRNEGFLALENVVLFNHKVEGEGIGDFGGILLNSGTCRVDTTTLQGGSANEGGGIYNMAGGEISISMSTVSNNRSRVGAGANNHGQMQITNSTFSENGEVATLYGGALENWGVLGLQHVTVANNWADKGGGVSNRGIVLVQNSIIAGNVGGDCHMPRYIYSNGYNLDSDDSCELHGEADLRGVDPGLKELKNYGGKTRTHMLFPWSSAYNSGLLINSISTDQRGMARPQGPAVDRGAVESLRLTIPPLVHPLLSH